MKGLNNLFESLCQPNPLAFPNETEASVTFNKNKLILATHIALLAIQMISVSFFGFQSGIALVRLGTASLMLGFFLLFCRRWPLVSRIINAGLLNLAGLIVIAYHPDRVYFGLMATWGIPCGVFYMTQSVKLTAITSCFQLFMLQISFKESLIQAVNMERSEIFAEKFVGGSMSFAIPLQVLYLIVLYNLNKKTDELSKATKKAEDALEQQKIFLYSFSHEMRNPMNSLLGNLDLALMGEIANETREMLKTAKVCGVLLLNLINTVLDAGKLGIGKLEVNPDPTRVYDVFQKVWSISHDIISKKGLKSHLKISRQVPPKLLLDSHRLNQVLMNLIGNATKFTEHGEISVSVDWLEEQQKISDECFEPIPYDDEDEGVFEKEYNLYAVKRRYDEKLCEGNNNQSLILSGNVKEFSLERIVQRDVETKGVLKIIIRDSGCGMTKEELSKLFKKFSQVGEKVSSRQMGTGLGLYISKEIVENMKGEIRVYSKSKIGSTFVICIPTTAMPMRIESQQPMNVETHLIPKLKTKKLTSIVADDSAFNVSLVCNFYSKIGVKVLTTANNGKVIYEKYLDMVKSGANIDVVTLDIDMPLMSGKDVCKRIREYEQKNHLKRSMILLISGNYEEKDLGNVLNGKDDGMGADCFLRKPLVFEELCWVLYKYKLKQ